MNYLVRANSGLPKPRAWTVSSPLAKTSRPKELDIVTRRYSVKSMSADDKVKTETVIAPAMPVFESAFSAFAQGTLIQSVNGNIAIEDLSPGDEIAMVDGGTQTVQWIGSMTLFPNAVDLGLPSTQLYRITEGSYGLDRSAPDLMLGAAARILPGLYAIDSSSNLINIDDLSDGHSVIKIRQMSAVQTFHIGLTNHGLMRANGIAVESFHPGSEPQTFLNQDLLGMYLALFPHVESLRDFGPLNHMRQR